MSISLPAVDSSLVLHKVMFPASDAAPDCAMLLDERIIPLLPIMHSPLTQPETKMYYISTAGDKGAGMFALDNIAAGALICIEHPIIITPAVVALSPGASMYEALFGQLEPLARAELLTMVNSRTSEECSSLEEGIARTNGTGVGLPAPAELADSPEAMEYGAVFLNINRSNHSCGPNAAQKWDLASFSLSLYALRPIAAGEEITMIYTDATASRAVRRAHLRRLYGFDCACAYCALPSDAAIAASDAARAELRAWGPTHLSFARWAADLCRADDALADAHARALALIVQEGMHGMQLAFLADIARSCAERGHAAPFAAWGARVQALCVVADPPMARVWAAWLACPEAMPRWGWRRDQRLRENGVRVPRPRRARRSAV